MDNEGGYMVLAKDVPEIIREAQIVAERFLGIFAFRLLCEANGKNERRNNEQTTKKKTHYKDTKS